MIRAFVLGLFIALSACAQAPEKAQEKESEMLPRNLEQAVNQILSGMSEEDKEKIKNTAFLDLYMYHHGWGTGIRNGLGLWRGNSELLKSACGGEVCHPDDASMQIIFGVWNTLNGKPIRYKPEPTMP